ncbi:hypothetical protein Q8A67_019874 [Cirrhinus molitorella]|uniref:Uncharacterized protein n=1 Tax=Cirrhinus molitorella TaxID=172907 RepID=A0AA88PBH8_9TELE|nr:hypothetical protein Q8A67_019874 [Cirrhinus molitorella]
MRPHWFPRCLRSESQSYVPADPGDIPPTSISGDRRSVCRRANSGTVVFANSSVEGKDRRSWRRCDREQVTAGEERRTGGREGGGGDQLR